MTLLGRNGEVIVARVITPPEPFVKPTEIHGVTSDDDAAVLSMIGAAQEDIDGPDGWLGRALGPQLLEVSIDRWFDLADLPCPPLLEIESVQYVDPAGEWQSWPMQEVLYWNALPATRGQRGDIRIRYWAGYGTRSQTDAARWVANVPHRARQAVILTVQHAMQMLKGDIFQTQENVVGIGSKMRSVTPYVSQAVRDQIRSLVRGLKVPRI